MEKGLGFEQTLFKLKVDISLTRRILIVFGLLAVVLKFLVGVAVPLVILVLLFFWVIIYFIFEDRLGRAKKINQLFKLYFISNTIDLFLITIVVHYLGGVVWIGAIFYIISLVVAGLMLPARQTFALFFLASLFYGGLVFFEWFGLVPHRPMYVLIPSLYRTPAFVIPQALVMITIFYFIAETTVSFSKILREKVVQLDKEKQRALRAYEKSKEAEQILEVRVGARTKELEDLVKTREEIIEERTRELKRKVTELEKFQKLVIGRELKMLELKKKIKELAGK